MYCYNCFLCIIYKCSLCIAYNCFLCIVYNCCIVYRIFLLSCISVTGHFHYEAFPLRGFPSARYIHGISVFSAHSLLNLIFQYSRYIVQELHVCSIVLHFLAAFEGVMSVFLFLLFHIFYGFLTLFLPHPCFSKAKRQRH